MTRTAPPPEVIPASASKWAVSKVKPKGGQRIVIYGGGGKGKTSLAATLPSPMFIFLGSERPSTDVPNIPNVKSWEDIRAVLREPSLWTGVESIVIDSATVAEALAIDFTLRTVKTEKGGVLQFGGEGCAEAFNHFAEGIARLSYCPGGVRFCGIRWEYEIGRWSDGKHGVPDDDGSSPNSIGQLFDPSRFRQSAKESP